MKSSFRLRLLPTEGQSAEYLPGNPEPSSLEDLLAPARRAVRRTRQWLLSQQHADGYWCAELEGDSILQSETILLLAFLGRETTDLAARLAQRLIETQLPEGGWAMYPGGGLEISGSVKAYFALKLTGHEPCAPYMERARRAILAHGGADAVNSFTRFYLALLGQISYDQCPAVPPELALLPRWFPVNLGAMSSWSRTIVVPLSIVSARRPVHPVEPERGIRELFLKPPDQWPPLRQPEGWDSAPTNDRVSHPPALFSWGRFFRAVDTGLKWLQRQHILPLRSRAIEAARSWMLQRFQGSDGLGAIYPPIVWSIVALKSLGYPDESPEIQYNLDQLHALVLDDERGGSSRVQPCQSPVWDTAIALRALAAAGVRTEDRSLQRAANWLLDRQIDRPGDWSATVACEPGGWCFEHANDFYPDNDDTAMVVMALHAAMVEEPMDEELVPPEFHLLNDAAPGDDALISTLRRTPPAIERGLKWLLAMQNDDGGWGAFDRNNDREFLCHVPFADHNAMIDPSTPDLTGRVLEALGQLGYRTGDPAVDRAVAYLRKTQEADGSWYGRWGVNYIYGTWQVLTGLTAVGIGSDDPPLAAGANWLLAYQQSSGGWGESPDSYARPELRGQGTPTASQTAWALLGLMAAGRGDHPAVARGVRWLAATQQADGTWREPEFTGTGFPKVFYLRYHYYPIYFPLLALARWMRRS